MFSKRADTINKDVYIKSFRQSFRDATSRLSTAKESSIDKEEYHHERLMDFELYSGISIINWWLKKENEEHDSRKKTTVTLLWFLGMQLLLINLMVVGIGVRVIEFDDSFIQIFITGTFVEITALLGVIVAYFFNERKIDPLNIALKITENMSNHNEKYYNKQNAILKKDNENIGDDDF